MCLKMAQNQFYGLRYMLEILNWKVYDLRESVIACRNSMRVEPCEYTDEEFEKSLARAVKLARCGGGTGESNFRTGIRVSFDLRYPSYIAPELQRYHFFDIVCSMSKMHKLSVFDKSRCFNEYVCAEVRRIVSDLSEKYNSSHSKEDFMRLISNCPLGVELVMRCSTNYEQLATIYRQRRRHRLEDWHVFCDWIETLPYAKELIICGKNLED